MSTEHKALIQRWFDEVWNQGRAEAIDEMLAEHAIIHGLGPDLRGPSEFKPFHSSYLNAFPDITIRIDDVIAEGNMVTARWSGSGTHQGDGLGVPATGGQVQFNGMTIARVEQGRIVEGWNVFDQLGMFQQLGVVNLP